MKIRPRFIRYALLFGIQWNRRNRSLLLLPFPSLGLEIQWGKPALLTSKETMIAAATLRGLAEILRRKSGDQPFIQGLGSGQGIIAAIHFTQRKLADELEFAGREMENSGA